VVRARGLLLGLGVLGATSARALAQNADSALTVRAEEALVRVRRYTTNDVASARALADSLVNALPAGASMMPEALYAKASIAPSAADAERTYARIVTDYRFAARVPDALMRLALLESARNNRAGALRHLDRLLRDHGDSPVRSRASLLAGRLRLEANDLARACDLLAAAYASANATERDVRDQAEMLGARCPVPVSQIAARDAAPAGVVKATVARTDVTPTQAAQPARSVRRDSVAAARVKPAPVPRRVASDSAVAPVFVARNDSAAKPVPARRDSVVPQRVVAPPAPAVERAPAAQPIRPPVIATGAPVAVQRVPAAKMSTPPATVPTTASTAPTAAAAPAMAPVTAERFGVQFAAYNDRPGAEQFAAVLRGKGIAARVEGAAAPFRVRAGRFTTRQEAEAAAALWRRPGQAAIVVPLGAAP
jgi:DedD protein